MLEGAGPRSNPDGRRLPAPSLVRLAQRDAPRLPVTAIVTAEQIRDLTADSVIIVVQVREAVTSTAGHSRASEDVVVIPGLVFGLEEFRSLSQEPESAERSADFAAP